MLPELAGEDVGFEENSRPPFLTPCTPGLDPQVEPSSAAEELRLVLHIKEVEVRSKELEQEEVHL